MKSSLTFFATIVAVSVLLFSVVPTNACEQSCRTGISLAFGDNYSKEVDKLFPTLSDDLKNHLVDGFSGSISSATKSSFNKIIDDETDKCKKAFTGNFAKLIEDSIFNQAPQFKGQCQHPLRVNQPPPGVAWTMDDCQNQDYICGNPPAVCHYMDQIVKPRNVKNVNESLKDRLSTNGSCYSSLIRSLIIAAAKSNIKASDLDSFATAIEKNVGQQYSTFTTLFEHEFCRGTTCDKYDHDIKVKLLSYP
ncbi:hypothetical protein RclHR1_00500018 [Rhizophagus clarus]|uniref:Uncharacterized protein n=1 Tax=Rhizophagus clarus TaxID=94130 RepID=A0A2Z6S237_9GLOM|nr:hypothetical protein RclHR1_00500018 [Rhizophagus clarus]GES97484.1 hypothetical protein GLOIN_2v1657018 [Rhizophagus clarus]